MTTSRIVRGTKARVLLYICAVLIITGIIACYNNTLSQLEDAKKSNDICHQQEENLSSQLQVISEYKQRLEKSLKTEKAEHQQSKNELEKRLNEERTKNEKATNEANLRFSSMQQHFNMVQTQYEDLQTKLKELDDELKNVKAARESLKSKVAELESRNAQIQSENSDLQKQVEQHVKDNDNDESQIVSLGKENSDLKKEIAALKAKCSLFDSIQPPNIQPEAASPQNGPNSNVQPEGGAALLPPMLESLKQVQPPSQNLKTPSKSTTSSGVKPSQGKLNGARPLLVPTVTPKSKASQVLANPKKVPEGVVRVPEKHTDKKTEEEKNELPEINNRYRNKISDSVLQEPKKVDDDKENGAHEVFDQHNMYDNIGFGELNEPIKNAEKQNFNKQHDQFRIDGNKIYDEDNQQNEENDPEDDDEYGDHLGKIKDPVIRH